jgi:hypothetical protein
VIPYPASTTVSDRLIAADPDERPTATPVSNAPPSPPINASEPLVLRIRSATVCSHPPSEAAGRTPASSSVVTM